MQGETRHIRQNPNGNNPKQESKTKKQKQDNKTKKKRKQKTHIQRQIQTQNVRPRQQLPKPHPLGTTTLLAPQFRPIMINRPHAENLTLPRHIPPYPTHAQNPQRLPPRIVTQRRRRLALPLPLPERRQTGVEIPQRA